MLHDTKLVLRVRSPELFCSTDTIFQHEGHRGLHDAVGEPDSCPAVYLCDGRCHRCALTSPLTTTINPRVLDLPEAVAGLLTSYSFTAGLKLHPPTIFFIVLHSDKMPRPLTFGIEFEFALATIPLGFNPPKCEKTDGLPLALRCDAPPKDTPKLYQEAFTSINTLLNDYDIPTILTPPERGTTTIGLRSLDNTRWHLEKDCSIRGPNRQYHWLQIELISRVLPLTRDGIVEAGLVAKLVEEEFRVSTNTSTGMHIHIGDGSLGFPLKVCQRVMGFFYVFDEQLKYLHPPFRRNHEYARNIRLSCMLNIANTWSVEESLESIMTAKTIDELEFGLGGRRPAVNLKNLRSGGDPNKKTIEFRQHAATLDIHRIDAWIQTVGGIVDWCRNATEDEYRGLVHESAHEQDSNQPLSYPTAVDVLRAIGLDKKKDNPVKFYKKRLAKTKGREPQIKEVIDTQPLSEEYVVDSSGSNDTAREEDKAATSDMDLD